MFYPSPRKLHLIVLSLPFNCPVLLMIIIRARWSWFVTHNMCSILFVLPLASNSPACCASSRDRGLRGCAYPCDAEVTYSCMVRNGCLPGGISRAMCVQLRGRPSQGYPAMVKPRDTTTALEVFTVALTSVLSPGVTGYAPPSPMNPHWKYTFAVATTRYRCPFDPFCRNLSLYEARSCLLHAPTVPCRSAHVLAVHHLMHRRSSCFHICCRPQDNSCRMTSCTLAGQAGLPPKSVQLSRVVLPTVGERMRDVSEACENLSPPTHCFKASKPRLDAQARSQAWQSAPTQQRHLPRHTPLQPLTRGA
eukprot:211128-Chlamydomonas_euryale.AAC.11